MIHARYWVSRQALNLQIYKKIRSADLKKNKNKNKKKQQQQKKKTLRIFPYEFSWN